MPVSCCDSQSETKTNTTLQNGKKAELSTTGQFGEMLTSFLDDSRSTVVSLLDSPLLVVNALKLPSVSSNVLLDETRKQVAGIGMLLRFNKELGYMMCDRVASELYESIVETAPEVPVIGKNGMSIKLPGTLATCQTCAEPETLEPVFIHYEKQRKPVQQVLIDEVQRTGFGFTDIDRSRSIAIDLDHSSPVWHVYRDEYGFCVNSPAQFLLLSLRCQDFVDRCSGVIDESLAVSEFNESEFLNLLQYDARISGEYRKDFMRFLLELPGVACLLARGSNRIQGYALYNSQRVFALYAESATSARRLLSDVCKRQASATKLQCFVVQSDNSDLLETILPCATIEKRIRRLYTAFIPTNIAWNNIFVANCGLSLL